MKCWLHLVCGVLALLVLPIPATYAAEIPLSAIWATAMPGTQDVRSIEPEDATQRDPRRPTRTQFILRKLSNEPHESDALPGFIVSGEPLRALSWAKTAFYKGKPLSGYSLPVGEEIYLVFFWKDCAYQVEIERVSKKKGVFDIQYRFVPQGTAETSVGFALIPVGKLPVGDYRVQFTRSPLAQEYLDAGFEPVSDEQVRKIVSKPFTFSITEPVEPDSGPRLEGESIPLSKIWAWGMPGTQPVKKLTEGSRESKQQIEGILKKLSTQKPDTPTPAGFSVLGTGATALSEAYSVIVEGQKAKNSFPASSDVSLIFFSRELNYYVQISNITKKANEITIQYQFVPHRTKEVTQHFAIIPIKKLPIGHYLVHVQQQSMDQAHIKAGFKSISDSQARNIVCGPFSFDIEEDNQDQP